MDLEDNKIDRISVRRVYKDRRHEFDMMTPEQIEEKLRETQTTLKQIKEKLKADATNIELENERKELANYITRCYTRLKKFGKGRISENVKPVPPPTL